MAENEEMTFWEHLDQLRGYLLKMLAVAAGCAIVAFCFKDTLFDIVLAQAHSDFIIYQLMGAEPFELHLVNIDLTEQFMVHLRTAFAVGIIGASPYILYLLYRFIAPALYQEERRYAGRLVTSAYLLFLVGVLVNYFLVFPLTVRFLGTYSVSEDVSNMLSLQSYMNTLLMMTLVFGVVFEIPVVSWLLAMFGLLRAEWMQQYRRHAVVVILVIAAIITPTSDIFTLSIVSLPIWLLYESSIWIVKSAQKRRTD